MLQNGDQGEDVLTNEKRFKKLNGGMPVALSVVGAFLASSAFQQSPSCLPLTPAGTEQSHVPTFPGR